MRRRAAIGVDDDLAPGQPRIPVRAADDEGAGRVDVPLGVGGDEALRQHLLDIGGVLRLAEQAAAEGHRGPDGLEGVGGQFLRHQADLGAGGAIVAHHVVAEYPRRAGVRPQGQRDHNERLILSTLQRLGPLPGSDLARLAGLGHEVIAPDSGRLACGDVGPGRMPDAPVLVARVLELAKSAKIGDPMQADTNVGPITTPAQYKKVLDYIDIAKAEGARCLLGGRPASGDGIKGGQFVEPTIFTDVDNSMRIAREEVFGPVLSIISFDTEADAVRIANDTIYGLAAGIWTKDLARAIRVPKQLRAGTVWVNTYRAISYMMPFGGVKVAECHRRHRQHGIDDHLIERR